MFIFFNVFFAFKLLLKLIAQPQVFFINQGNMLSLFIILCSFASFYLENYAKNTNLLFLKSLLLSFQLLRITLIIEDTLFLKKFFYTLKIILKKSFPFIILFVCLLYIYAIIGLLFFLFIFIFLFFRERTFLLY